MVLMVKRNLTILTMFCIILLTHHPIIAAESGGTGITSSSKSKFSVPEEKTNQWIAIQKMVDDQYRVCTEHCGGSDECVNKCKSVADVRLQREYNAMMAARSAKSSDIDEFPHCPLCGMDRDKFGFSRVLLVYDDGSHYGTCSIHCAAIDLAININKSPLQILIADYNTHNMIDAEKAYWVIGGQKPGIMTKRAKWAFQQQADAEHFMKSFGGELAAFDQVLKATYEDMYQDVKMIREKRNKKSAPAVQQKSETDTLSRANLACSNSLATTVEE